MSKTSHVGVAASLALALAISTRASYTVWLARSSERRMGAALTLAAMVSQADRSRAWPRLTGAGPGSSR